jgi:hypothetical protein
MLDSVQRQKVVLFVFSALDDGWSVKKQKEQYVFSKPHEGKKEVFSKDFLYTFIDKHARIPDDM